MAIGTPICKIHCYYCILNVIFTRFAEIRNTIQGKQEERLPFFAFVLPQWFQTKYGTEYKYFMENVNKLTTPFDIYTTLKYVLNPNIKQTGNRSLSLFAKVGTALTTICVINTNFLLLRQQIL